MNGKIRIASLLIVLAACEGRMPQRPGPALTPPPPPDEVFAPTASLGSAETTTAKAPTRPTPTPLPPELKTPEAPAFNPGEFESVQYIPTSLAGLKTRDIQIVSADEVKASEQVVFDKPEPSEITKKTVTVAKGDTIYSLAKKYDVKVYDLADMNNIKAPFTIKVGQKISVPDRAATPEPRAVIVSNLEAGKSFIEEPKRPTATIKKGDTLFSIARANDVALRDLIVTNNLQAPYTLTPGQALNIPGRAFVIVQKSDTLYSISRRFGVNMKSLADANKIGEDGRIVIGQRLVLPGAADAKTTVNTALVTDKKGRKEIVAVTPPPKPARAEPNPDPAKTEPTRTEPSKPSETAKSEAQPKTSDTPTTTAAPTQPSAVKIVENREIVREIIMRPEPMSRSRFAWPITGQIVSDFGPKGNGTRNDGINIAAPVGTSVVSAENGIVAYSGNEIKGLGNLIIIRHDKDYMTVYAHLKDLKVRKGERVTRGQAIATVGNTGRVPSAQLHFEIRQRTKAINPAILLEKK